MGKCRTFAYLSGAAALLGGLQIAGCAANADEPGGSGPESLPSQPAPAASTSSSPPSSPPPFEADFSHAPASSPSSSPSRGPTSSGAACADDGDPGSGETVAKALPDTDDCNDDHQDVHGIVDGAVDVDFYALSATDRGISLEHPFGCRLDTDFAIDAPGAELCVFVRCKNSTATDVVTGCAAGTPQVSDLGMKGCCTQGPGRAVPQWDCSGFADDDSSDFFVRVRSSDPSAGNRCLPYDVSYRF